MHLDEKRYLLQSDSFFAAQFSGLDLVNKGKGEMVGFLQLDLIHFLVKKKLSFFFYPTD
ncbi:hypothetical protein BACSP_03484 [Bacillus sp. T2.9-1]|nr:hypothetical protein BACSP_03484 [Bacillus sp. T2.9-1]